VNINDQTISPYFLGKVCFTPITLKDDLQNRLKENFHKGIGNGFHLAMVDRFRSGEQKLKNFQR